MCIHRSRPLLRSKIDHFGSKINAIALKHLISSPNPITSCNFKADTQTNPFCMQALNRLWANKCPGNILKCLLVFASVRFGNWNKKAPLEALIWAERESVSNNGHWPTNVRLCASYAWFTVSDWQGNGHRSIPIRGSFWSISHHIRARIQMHWF